MVEWKILIQVCEHCRFTFSTAVPLAKCQLCGAGRPTTHIGYTNKAPTNIGDTEMAHRENSWRARNA